jgi:ketosteroid isomerase-like protein
MLDMQSVIDDYIAAYNAKDVTGMLACLDDGVEFANISGGAVNAQTQGKAQFAELAAFGVSAFAARRQTVKDRMTVGERTMLRVAYEATVARDLPNGWKAGQSLSFEGISYFELRDGRIVRIIDAA